METAWLNNCFPPPALPRRTVETADQFFFSSTFSLLFKETFITCNLQHHRFHQFNQMKRQNTGTIYADKYFYAFILDRTKEKIMWQRTVTWSNIWFESWIAICSPSAADCSFLWWTHTHSILTIHITLLELIAAITVLWAVGLLNWLQLVGDLLCETDLHPSVICAPCSAETHPLHIHNTYILLSGSLRTGRFVVTGSEQDLVLWFLAPFTFTEQRLKHCKMSSSVSVALAGIDACRMSLYSSIGEKLQHENRCPQRWCLQCILLFNKSHGTDWKTELSIARGVSLS